MTNYKLHNEFKKLSGYVYKNGEIDKPDNWIDLQSKQNKNDGFYAEIFSNEDNIVMVFRGTDDRKDWTQNNIKMAASFLPSQITDARNFYKQVKKDFPNQKIYLTGHSLGGSIAQAIGAETGEETITFGAYGLKNTYSPTFKNVDNITNYGNQNDPIFTANIANQLGKTYIMGDWKEGTTYIDEHFGYNLNISKSAHWISTMGDIEKAIEYKGENLQTEESKLFKLSIEKTVDLQYADPNKIITREEIAKMTPEEFARNEECINQKMKEGKIMSEAQAKSKEQQEQSSPAKGTNSSSGGSGDGRWVTINGNHVFMD